jgi:hypothetical protein
MKNIKDTYLYGLYICLLQFTPNNKGLYDPFTMQFQIVLVARMKVTVFWERLKSTRNTGTWKICEVLVKV